MGETLIRVENLSKKFCRDLKRSLWYGMRDLCKELLAQVDSCNGHLRDYEFWAVKNINFHLERGQCLGLIGKNGAGKTTLLRLLNGLIKPDQGRIEIFGRVGALISLGAGFNPILTGRENIYVNAAVLGISKRETDAKFEEIVEFAELGKFIDTPVQSYSSGMTVRLGFAVATALEPDVLILDEVLAVGDIGFRHKCHNKVKELADKCAVIVVSHSMPSVARLSSHILLLQAGEEKFLGEDVSRGIELFNDLFANTGMLEIGTKYIQIHKCILYGCEKGNSQVSYLGDLTIEIEFSFLFSNIADYLFIDFFDSDSTFIAEAEIELSQMNMRPNHRAQLTAIIPSILFSSGNYSVSIVFWKSDKHGPKGSLVSQRRSIANFAVMGPKRITAAPIMLRTKQVVHEIC